MKPLVAHMIVNLETGGAQGILMQWARFFPRDRYRTIIVGLREPNHYGPVLDKLEVPHFIVPVRRKFPAQDLRALGKFLQEQGVDIAHSSATYANWAGRAAAIYGGVPHVIAHFQNVNEKIVDDGFLKLERFLAQYSDAIALCSKGVRDWVEENVDTAGAAHQVIQNCVDLTTVRQEAARRRENRDRLGISPDTFHILHTARLEARKRPETLMKAVDLASRASDRWPMDWRLTYVGGGSEEEALKNLLAKLAKERPKELPSLHDHICFTGWSTEVPAWLSTADVFALMSRSEGFPLTLVEAMASGASVIAADIIGPRDLVSHGMDGILTDGGNPEAVANDLLNLAVNPEQRRALGAAAMETAKGYDSPRLIDDHLALYGRLEDLQPSKARPKTWIGKELFLYRFRSLYRYHLGLQRQRRKAEKRQAKLG